MVGGALVGEDVYIFFERVFGGELLDVDVWFFLVDCF